MSSVIAQSTMEKCSESPLFKLPAELRNQIYRYALGRWHYCWINVRTGEITGSRSNALLGISRKVKEECEPLLVQATTFNFRFTGYFDKPVEFAALKTIVPYIAEMWNIRIMVEKLIYRLDMSQGLEKYRFDVLPGSVSSAVANLAGNYKGLGRHEEAKDSQDTIDALVVKTLAKGTNMLDGMIKSANVRGEIPVMNLEALTTLIEIIGKELETTRPKGRKD